MNKCTGCSALESAEDPLACCDGCSCFLCKTCASLSSTEMRAVVLKKRTIIFHCARCRSLQDAAVDMARMKDSILRQIRQEYSRAAELCRTEILAEVQSGFKSVLGQITALRQSNIDLVGLLTGGSQPSPTVLHGPLVSRTYSAVAAAPRLDDGRRPIDDPGTGAPQEPVVNGGREVSSLDSSAVMPGDVRAGKAPALGVGRPFTLGTAADATGSSQRNRRRVVTGTRKISGSKITAAVVRRKSSVFVGRLAVHVTESDLTEYLQATFGTENRFIVEKLIVRSGDYNSFRVEMDVELLDRVYCADNWPEDVVVKRFRFFRSKGDAPKVSD